jgi:metal-responsive CopG/Arc/MetJ family transcriptional regulator
MTEPKKRGPGRPRTTDTVPTRQTLRIQPGNYTDLERLAKQWGATRSELVNRAIREFVVRKTAERDEENVIPLIRVVLEEVLERHDKRLASLLVRNGMETLRLQYVLLNFMTEASIPAGKVERWRNDGWQFARKEYKRRPIPDEEEEE